MPYAPDLQTFLSLADGHQLVPVYRCLLSDSLTPVSAFHKLDEGGCACLFESVIGGEKVGRHSFLAVSPFPSAWTAGSSFRWRGMRGI